MKRMNAISKTDIFSHWVNISYLPRWGVLLLDLLIVLVSFTISKVIGTNLLKYEIFNSLLPIWGQVLLLLVVQTLFFWAFHTYSGILRFSTFRSSNYESYHRI
jgi:FlaA1/EpsC-like NDP-sugar epimerase